MYTNTFLQRENNYLQTMTREKGWAKRLDKVIHKYVTNLSFNNKKLAQELEVSQRDLFRKVKKATGYSPNQYVQKYRLKIAMQHLKNGDFKTVNETATAIGYSNVGYFISQFEKKYNKTPLKVLQENGWR